ncbi:dialkylresorcinol condensing enzyme DarA [Aquimarina sp. W85]|uniref:dialkylrecorsinol condensing enzyme DarA n=1 Tax=Aquimarina rhodophyticola TaxID=3342246 RepID=UPI003670F74F
MKNVLILYYSQSGQLYDVLRNIAKPLMESAHTNVVIQPIEPIEPFNFPWKKKDFFQVFPETFLQKSVPIKPLPDHIKNGNFDLVILGYTVWYLSPSLPINSFLKSEDANTLLQNTPVVTVNASRNMWIMAQEKIKKLLVDANAKLVGNIAFVDRHINHISVITIVHWMMGGKKTRYLGVFPKPGVSDEDINSADKFGEIIKTHLESKELETLQKQIVTAGGVLIKPFLIRSDQGGNRVFNKWSKIIYKAGQKSDKRRARLLKFFNYYLLFAIWIVVPIVFIIFLLTYLPLYGKIKRDKVYYQSVMLR